MAHRRNPYLTTNQKDVLCAMEWVVGITSVAVPIILTNCWNPLGWTAGAITLIGIGITALGVATISCTESHYMRKMVTI